MGKLEKPINIDTVIAKEDYDEMKKNLPITDIDKMKNLDDKIKSNEEFMLKFVSI